MAVRKTAKTDLVEKAGYLFRTRGYHNTSISDIAEACNLSKASIYHHITSKHELAILAINRVHDYFRDHLFAIAYDETRDHRARLKDMALKTFEIFECRDGGCLIGNLTLEVIDTDVTLGDLFRNFFNDWSAAISHLLKSTGDEAKADAQAESLVAHIQGAVMMSRLYKSKRPLENIKETIIESMS